jgi:hypothetical protein
MERADGHCMVDGRHRVSVAVAVARGLGDIEARVIAAA